MLRIPAQVTDPVFVRSTLGYRAYSDFWRLVELSGFPVIDRARLDLSSDTLYVWVEMDTDLLEPLHDTPKHGRRARTAFWNLEPVDRRASKTISATGFWRASLDQTLGLMDDVWVSDRAVMALDHRPTWVSFGGHKGLVETVAGTGPVYDVAHIGQLTPRREKVIEELRRRDISVSPSPGGDERISIFTTSRLMLDVQRLEGMPLVTPIRWVTAAAYKLPMVREELPDPDPLVPGESIILAPYEALADRVEEALAGDPAPVGLAAYRVLCENWTFRRAVEDVMNRGAALQQGR